MFDFEVIEALARRRHPDPDVSDSDLAMWLGIDRRTLGRYRSRRLVDAYAVDRMCREIGEFPACVFPHWASARTVCAEYRQRRRIAA